MANTLPVETKYREKEFPAYHGKSFREFADGQITKDFPKAILEKDSLESKDENEIKEWYALYSPIIERAISDYVHAFHKACRGSTL